MSAWNSREREQRAEAARYWERRQRIALVKTILKVAGVVLGLLATGAGALYLAVRLVRLAWGQS